MSELFWGFLIDLAIGDPVYPYHPVRLMGRAIEKAENFLREIVSNPKKAGAILAFGFPAAVFILSWAIIQIFNVIHPGLGWMAGVYGIYSAVSVKDLQQEGRRIFFDLQREDLQAARTHLSGIVGRDTASLERPGILRAAIEAIAESTVDGVIAPLFFAALGGAPLALAYKAVNTLDSMVGHQNERYQEFGFFSAKLDEAVNWIPARLSIFFTAAAARICGFQARQSWDAGWKYGNAASSGNGNYPEAAFAGALGIQLGGPSSYQGRVVEKALLGTAEKELELSDLEKSLTLMMTVSWVSFVIFLGAKGLFHE